MDFHILNTAESYRRLLEAPDEQVRERIFWQEIAEPFEALIPIFGGGNDMMAVFEQWGMSPAQFSPENHEPIEALLDTLTKHDAWQRSQNALEKVRNVFSAYRHQIPIETVTFGLLYAEMPFDLMNAGYNGFGAIPGYVMLLYNRATEQNLRGLEAIIAHETHHNIAAATKTLTPNGINPMFMTVGQYLVVEGLAEAFAAELYAEENLGMWTLDFDEDRLEDVKTIYRDGLSKTGFDTLRAYLFGDEMATRMNLTPAGLPDFAGYTIGYRMVKQYLEKTGKSAVEATFISADDIIRESEFFV